MQYQQEAHFSSYEEFNSFPHGWDVEFSATSPRDYEASLHQSMAPGILVNTAQLSSATLQRGSTPVGMRTFALPLELPSPYCWRGRPVDENTLITFPDDRELFSTMGAGVEMLTISIDQAQVDSLLEKWELSPESVFSAPRTEALSAERYWQLRQDLGLMTEFMLEHGQHPDFSSISRGLYEKLLEQMLEPLQQCPDSPRVSKALAAKRVKVATDYILSKLGEPLTVIEICSYLRCSRRSLEQDFRQYAGTSPKQFIQLIRLTHCRQSLLAAAPDATVQHIAGQLGFWHMGEFARIYRRVFRETPSQTLKRGH